MSKKNTQIFECNNCGNQSPKWLGKCDNCNTWNTYELLQISNNNNLKSNHNLQVNSYKIKEVAQQKKQELINTYLKEFNNVLGGGFLGGHTVLLFGEPGVGKSTLLIQIASEVKLPCYYICGEESPFQIKSRFKRLNLKDNNNINLLENRSSEQILSYLSTQPKGLIILDSIHSIESDKFKSSQGSIAQIKEVSNQFVNFSKFNGFPLIIVGQLNKAGTVSGPKNLEHIVDTVLSLEGDSTYNFRVLRALKNRFGSTDEVGLFLMEETGLQEVKEPSKILLEGNQNSKLVGSALSILVEGNRALAIEVQALTNTTNFGFPKRSATGFDLNRLNMLCAVITKYTKFNLNEKDVYLNIAGGLKIKDPAIDLAVIVAIISSILNKPTKTPSVFLGEVGLSGELRKIKLANIREKSCKRTLKAYNIFIPAKYKNINEIISKVF